MNLEKAKEFPSIVNVNVLTGRCPCRCVHCPVGTIRPEDRMDTFGFREMELALFARIANEISLHKDSLMRIHSVGEPLLWGNLHEALRILRENDTMSWIFTSAVTGDRDLLSELCESISIIEVSVNAASSEEYRRTKGIDAFETVAGNIFHMSSYIRQKDLKTRLLLSRVQTEDECADQQFLKYWQDKKLADDVFIRSYHNYNNILDIRSSSGAKKPCLVHWARASVDCDGTMVCCFNELFRKYTDDVILGSLDSDTCIAEIWKGEKLTAIRVCDMAGDFSKLPFNIPCSTCKSCQPIDTTRETSEKQLRLVTQC